MLATSYDVNIESGIITHNFMSYRIRCVADKWPGRYINGDISVSKQQEQPGRIAFPLISLQSPLIDQFIERLELSKRILAIMDCVIGVGE